MPRDGNIIALFGPGQGYRSRTVSAQRRLNLYLERQADPDASSLVMYGTPGLTPTLIRGGVAPPVPFLPTARGALSVSFGNYTVIVTGSAVYIRTGDGRMAFIGNINTATGRVGMADNGTQVIIVDGQDGWIVDYTDGGPTTVSTGPTYIWTWTTTILDQIVDIHFPNGATTACFIAGYFVVNKPDPGQFAWSALYDGMDWDPLDFATAESAPDPLVGVASAHGFLYLLGTQTIEPWAPSGGTTVFLPVSGAVSEWGLPTPWTWDRFGDNEIFLAVNRMGQYQVVVLSGTTVTPVSTPDIIHDMNLRTQIGAATGFSYLLDGHQFYQLNFPDKSYLYDGFSNAWSELSSGLYGNERHYAEIRFQVANVAYFTDYRHLQIYTQSLEVYTDDSIPIVRECEFKHVESNLARMTIDSLQIQFQPGVGLAEDVGGPLNLVGSDPQAMLSISRDGGATWGNEHWKTIGRIGRYLTRVIWRQLGRARDVVFKVRITDQVKIAIVNVAIIVR